MSTPAWVDCSAFPVTSEHYANKYCERGMSLRDYFAAKAMQGMLAGHFACYGHDNYWKEARVAQASYEMADAMMQARAAEGPA